MLRVLPATLDPEEMSKRSAHKLHGASCGANNEPSGSSSASSDDGEHFSSAEERLIHRHRRHAFIDLVVPAGSTCVGYLDLSISAVWIAKLCGKVISAQSLRSRDGCRTLSLTDALYAMERGCLMLRRLNPESSARALCVAGDIESGVVVSVQEMWAVVISSGIALEQYVVYRSLRDHGYSVFPQAAAHGALAVMHAVKAGTSTTVLVFSSSTPAETLMRCVSLLPGAELRPLMDAAPTSSSAHRRIAAESAPRAAPVVNGSVLSVRSACAAAVVDGTDVTWLGFDVFQ